MDNFIAIPEQFDIGTMERDAAVTYQEFVSKLAKPLAPSEHLTHMVLGVAGEAGELVDAIKKHTIYEKELDRKNVVEELGDLMFYMQGIMTPLGITWEEIAKANIMKLVARYSKLTYSNQAAIARADKVDGNG